ncbi:MAG: PstS family phosphate ABC transporter substrate-binding protein [Pseudomonadota bacterium]
MITKHILLATSLLTLVSTANAASNIKIDGSSTVYPITEAVVEEFQKLKRGKVRLTVGISGTGGGFKKFCRGEIDIADASRPIKKSEMDACKKAGIRYVEIPVAYDALTIVIHPDNTWARHMTVAELKKMWEPSAQGKIKKWSDINPKWPDHEFKLFGAGTDSGTFEYFTEAVNGKPRASRGDYTASEDDNVLVLGVSRNKHGLGYFGYAYYAENKNKLRAVAVHNGKSFVLPSTETVEAGSYQPLARPIFIYVSAKSMARPEVKEFVHFYLDNAIQLVKEVKYVPLPASAYAMARKNFDGQKLGTAFGGKNEVGLKINEILARKAHE